MKEKNNNEKLTERYVKEVSERLVCSGATKKGFLKEFKGAVDSFAAERQDLSMEDLYGEFGKPEIFASQFLEREDYAAMLKKAKKRTLLWIILTAAAVVIIGLLIAFIMYLLNTYGGEITVTAAQDVVTITRN